MKGAVLAGAVGAGAVLLLGFVRFRPRPASSPPAAPQAWPAPSPRCEVRRISLGFDWTRRRALQSALEALAGRHDMDTAGGMHAAARAVHALLREHMSAARYGAFSRYQESASGAEHRFASVANDLAARFSEETVRGADRRDFGAIAPRRDEGEGLVVVSVVLGAMRALPELPETLSTDALTHALATSLPDRADDLVAFEVIWSPSEDGDRMNSAELEMVYPDLARLDDATDVGRRICDYCRAPYPAELGRCPSCGAPVG